MKKIALIFASIFALTATTFAGNSSKNHKRQLNQTEQVSMMFQNRLGFPTEILNGTSESVVIAYSIDEHNIVHINHITGDNEELNNYIQTYVDGKRMNRKSLEGKSGVVKLYFKGA